MRKMEETEKIVIESGPVQYAVNTKGRMVFCTVKPSYMYNAP